MLWAASCWEDFALGPQLPSSSPSHHPRESFFLLEGRVFLPKWELLLPTPWSQSTGSTGHRCSEIEGMGYKSQDWGFSSAGWLRPPRNQHSRAWTGAGGLGGSKTPPPGLLNFRVSSSRLCRGWGGAGEESRLQLREEHKWGVSGELLEIASVMGAAFREARGCLTVVRKLYRPLSWDYICIRMHAAC